MSALDPSYAGDFRCYQCNRLLVKYELDSNTLEIKCTRCGHINPIFKGVNDQVIITDTKGVILYVNPLVEYVTGYHLQEVLGKTPALWGGQMSKEFYKELWHQIKDNQTPIAVKVRNRKKSGAFYNALLRITPVFDADGGLSMFVGMETVLPDP